MLKFGKGNAKLGSHIITFSLLSGWSCPGAKECKSKVIIVNGKRKIKDGPFTKFRCFSASNEALFPVIYNARQHNFKELKAVGRSLPKTIRLIQDSLPNATRWLRIHVAGDFFSQLYFDAWVVVAKRNPDILFYAYTKSITYWLKRMHKIPSNLLLTASFGGRHDELVKVNNLRYAKVVFSEAEARKLKLPIDHDDSHAYTPGGSFALLLHGTQPKGSASSVALQNLKNKGITGYNKSKRLPAYTNQ